MSTHQAQHAVSHEAVTQAPTRRQIAARKRAVRTKEVNQAAKAWLAGRKDSQTSIADRLIARYIGKGGTDVVYATTLLQKSLIRRRGQKRDYVQGYTVADELYGLFFSSAGACLADAVALMKEADIPAKY